jgi:hypothetical protein
VSVWRRSLHCRPGERSPVGIKYRCESAVMRRTFTQERLNGVTDSFNASLRRKPEFLSRNYSDISPNRDSMRAVARQPISSRNNLVLFLVGRT